MFYMNIWKKWLWTILLAFSSIFIYGGNKAAARVLNLGPDISIQWYADKSGGITLGSFLMLPQQELKTYHQIPSFGFSSNTYWMKVYLPASSFSGDELWLKLGPSFIDYLTIYYRPVSDDTHWISKEFGDRSTEKNSDINYRESVLILPPPVVGYEVVFKMHSTSTLLFLASLSSAKEFLENSTQDTAFWSFYFGVGLVVSGVALWLAIMLRRRLLWGVCLFSLNYLLVAALHGFPAWLFGSTVLPIQDYMISSLSLLGYATALWLHCEIFNLKKYMNRLYRFLIFIISVILLLQLSVPLDLYGMAMRLETVMFIIVSPVLIITSWMLWQRENVNILSLVIGLMPPIYVLIVVFILLSLNGFISFNNYILNAWQYTLVIHAFTVLILACLRVRAENLELEQKKELARELRSEREASFNQRQFMGVVAHEFRTPLAVIMAALDNLRLCTNFTMQRPRLDRIHRAATRLVQLTDNCLADARLSSASLSIESSKVPLFRMIKTAGIVVDLSENHYMEITFNGQTVTLDDNSPEICLDEGLLCIAIANILDNSVKYTPHGKIEIAIFLNDDILELFFSDEGPGIPAQYVEHVFERYYRVDTQKSNLRGTGLGLYVSRQIVQAHGGELKLIIEGAFARTFAMTINLSGSSIEDRADMLCR